MDKETEVWFAMRATYRRELEAMHLLEKGVSGFSRLASFLLSV